jgi:hypothetical protein
MGVKNFKETRVYKLAFEQAMDIYETSKGFPKEETYSLIDQIRRSSRSVCANIAEGYRKKRYPLILSQRFLIAILKTQRQMFGLIFHYRVNILLWKNISKCNCVMKKLGGYLIT